MPDTTNDQVPVDVIDPKGSASAPPETPLNELMNTAEVAALTGHTVATLSQYRSWRTTGRYPDAGPEFTRLGRSVFYTRQSVQAYLDRRA